jgi:hypothetical protein
MVVGIDRRNNSIQSIFRKIHFSTRCGPLSCRSSQSLIPSLAMNRCSPKIVQMTSVLLLAVAFIETASHCPIPFP